MKTQYKSNWRLEKEASKRDDIYMIVASIIFWGFISLLILM